MPSTRLGPTSEEGRTLGSTERERRTKTMKQITKKTAAISLLAALLLLPVASYAQFGFGGVFYYPTNYQNAVLRYIQLQEQLAQLRETYQQVLNQYQLAVEMAKNLQNMPAR